MGNRNVISSFISGLFFLGVFLGGNATPIFWVTPQYRYLTFPKLDKLYHEYRFGQVGMNKPLNYLSHGIALQSGVSLPVWQKCYAEFSLGFQHFSAQGSGNNIRIITRSGIGEGILSMRYVPLENGNGFFNSVWVRAGMGLGLGYYRVIRETSGYPGDPGMSSAYQYLLEISIGKGLRNSFKVIEGNKKWRIQVSPEIGFRYMPRMEIYDAAEYLLARRSYQWESDTPLRGTAWMLLAGIRVQAQKR